MSGASHLTAAAHGRNETRALRLMPTAEIKSGTLTKSRVEIEQIAIAQIRKSGGAKSYHYCWAFASGAAKIQIFVIEHREPKLTFPDHGSKFPARFIHEVLLTH